MESFARIKKEIWLKFFTEKYFVDVNSFELTQFENKQRALVLELRYSVCPYIQAEATFHSMFVLRRKASYLH